MFVMLSCGSIRNNQIKPLGDSTATDEPEGFLFMETHVCSTCKIDKPFSEYSKRNDTKKGIRYRCKSCYLVSHSVSRKTRKGVSRRIYFDQIKSSDYRGYDRPDYTLKEFRKWLFSQKDFERIYIDWVRSNYSHLLSVSCDRIDDYRPYTFDNIQLMTWGQNKRKGHDDRINGNNRKQSIPVCQMSDDGEVIAEFHSLSSAVRSVGGDRASISKCCKGERITSCGFKWKFSTEKTARHYKSKT
jgi:hypothetical protein